jgi:tetratricopeptide (TPR) repeat protein
MRKIPRPTAYFFPLLVHGSVIGTKRTSCDVGLESTFGGKAGHDAAVCDVGAVGSLPAAPVDAQTLQEIDWCNNEGNAYSLDLQINGCTASIQSRRESQQNPAAVYFNRGMAYYFRGLAYGGEKDYDRAIADYDQGIRLDPKDASAYYFRGLETRARGDTAGGDADIAQARQLDPNIGK